MTSVLPRRLKFDCAWVTRLVRSEYEKPNVRGARGRTDNGSSEPYSLVADFELVCGRLSVAAARDRKAASFRLN